MGQKSSSLVEGHRLSEHVTLGVLARVVPVDLVDAVLRETGRQNWRARQLLPRVVVCYVMALTLYAHASYDAVLRELVEGLRWLHWDGAALGLACKSAIPQARVRLGEAPLRELFRRIARPLAEPGAPGAWYRGRRLVSFDGTRIDVPDLPVLERHVPRPRAAAAAFPNCACWRCWRLAPMQSSPRSSPGLRLARSLWRARSWPISSLECCAWPTAPLSATPCGAMPPRPEPTCSGAPAASFPVFSVWTTAPS